MSMHTVYVCDNEYEYRENERQKDHASNLKLLFKKKEVNSSPCKLATYK